MSVFWCERAWLPAVGAPVTGVRVLVDAGRIAAVESEAACEPGDVRLPGIVLPGFANAHSHAFHRALRGRTHDRGGSFWTWRERMYALVTRLDPDSYLALARATYAEMALAGVTCVGEFHYLHHGPGGDRYDDPNAMSEALVQAARDAGIRLTLLDAVYLTGGLDADGHLPLSAVQQRFSDGDVQAWATRVAALAPRQGLRVGAAVHSVRAVPAEQLSAVPADLLHLHLSEQPAENAACHAHHGCSPSELLATHGLLGQGTTAVHATHLSDSDIELVGRTRTAVCACPGTEADLADGIGPFRRLSVAGSPLCVGSDQHASIDLLADARAVESYERLAGGRRGVFTQTELVDALTVSGHRSLGWDDAGTLAVGMRADLVAVDLDTPRTAGIDPGQVVMTAGAADVRTVVADGRIVVADGRHVLGDVGDLLAEAIGPLWQA
jgi:formiminoglutamate deiminase